MNNTAPVLSLVTLSLLLSACATTLTRETTGAEHLQQAFELPRQQTPQPPAEVAAALLPPLHISMPGLSDVNEEVRFDVRVRQMAARDFFLSLVDETPYNMVVDPKVSGHISLDLKNISVPETLEVVRNVFGYDYKRHGNTFQLFPNTMHTRIFRVDYLAATRVGESVTTSKTGQISTGSNNTEGSNNTANSSTIQTGSNADFWSELKSSLEMMIGNEGGRRVSVNPQTGVVMVRAMPNEMRTIEEYLEASQDILHRQVILEARILEVTLSDGFQSGINWTALSNSSGENALFSLGSGNSASAFSGGLSSTTATPFSSSNIGSNYNGPFTFGLFTQDFTTFIDLLKSQGDVQVLSSPRVSTVNNQKAVIKVGNDEFFVTNIDTQSNTVATGANTQVSVELDPFFSGVALDVIPQISDNGDIVLHVHPAVSEVREQTKTVATTFGTLSMPLAASNIRESDTVIRAANGQVVVIGGLMQTITDDTQNGLPILGDIPLLGGLFSRTQKTSRKSELVILLKPTVIDRDGNAWQQQLRRSSQHINEINRGR